MTEWDDACFARLNADATLLALLPGGLYVNLPVGGLSRDNKPAAYDTATGKMKVCGVVTGRNITPRNDLRDKAAQFMTVNQILEVWLYNDRDLTWPFAAADRVYVLLHERPLAGSFGLTLAERIKTRAPELGEAHLLRHDYQVVASLGG